MSNFSTFGVKPYTLNQKIGEKIWMIAGTGLDANSYLSGKVIKSGLTYLQADYPELFNIVGHGETTSVFTLRTSGTTSTINGITYGNGIYVCTGNGALIRTSTDAITWTARTSNASSGNPLGPIIYANGRFVCATRPGSGPAEICTSTDGITWTSVAMANGTSIEALTYGNGIYVQAGVAGMMRTSTDTITWTNINTPTTSTIRALTYINGIYIYAGSDGMLRTSTDTITWIDRTSGTNQEIRVLTTINNMCIYAGGGGVLGTSTDGITWTTRTSGTTSTINALTYGNGNYVMAGHAGMLRVSTDIVTWTARTLATTATINSLTYGNNIYVQVGVSGLVRTSTDLYYALNSSTYTYTTQFKVNSFTTTTIAFTSTVNATASIVGYVVGKNSANYSGTLTYPTGSLLLDYSGSAAPSGYIQTGAAYSQTSYPALYSQLGLINAFPWTARTSGTTSQINTLIYNSGLYVYGGVGGVLATSTNAVTWTARTSGTAQTINRIAYLNNLYIYVANSGAIGTSTDAITWTARTSNVTGNLTAVNWDGTKYVVGGNSIASSTDAINWTVHWLGGSTSKVGPEHWEYTNPTLGLHIGVGYSGLLMTSTDGRTWFRRTTGTSNFLGHFAASNSIVVVVGDGGVILTSSDGVTWTTRTSGTAQNLLAVVWNGTFFVIGGNSGVVLTSPDGITWTARTSGTTNAIEGAVATSTTTVLLFDSSGGISSSNTDCSTWTGFSNAGSVNYGAWAASPGGTIVVGYSNGIYTSTDHGVTWSNAGNNNNWFGATWTGTYFYMCGYSVIRSTNGLTWATVSQNPTTETVGIYAVGTSVYLGQTFNYGSVLARSTDDGVTWKSVMVSGAVTNVITNGTGQYVFSRNQGFMTKANLWVAEDALGYNGVDRTILQSSGYSADYHSSRYTGGKYLVCGGGSSFLRVQSSTDGITWTLATFGTANGVRDVDYYNGLYVAGIDNGAIYTSTDAITWTVRTSGTTSALYALTYGGGLYVYGGAGGVLATSTDAVTILAASYDVNTEFLVPEVNIGTSNHHKVWIKT